MRRQLGVGVVIAATAATVAVTSGAAHSSAHPMAAQQRWAAGTAQVPPGLRPNVQKWMKDRERYQIELNNALVLVVQKKLGTPSAAQAVCARLSKGARAMAGRGKAPDLTVDTLAGAGLAKFVQAAAACSAGDLGAAEKLVAEGLAERTAATEPLDETLEGE